jgi:hypothetical protein
MQVMKAILNLRYPHSVQHFNTSPKQESLQYFFFHKRQYTFHDRDAFCQMKTYTVFSTWGSSRQDLSQWARSGQYGCSALGMREVAKKYKLSIRYRSLHCAGHCSQIYILNFRQFYIYTNINTLLFLVSSLIIAEHAYWRLPAPFDRSPSWR